MIMIGKEGGGGGEGEREENTVNVDTKKDRGDATVKQ
jgi:hypothetical protein